MGFGMFSAQASPIAVDFGSSSIKLLQIASPEKPALVAAAELPVPEDIRTDSHQLFEFYASELPGLMRSGGFKGKRVICVVPSGRTFVQHMQIAPVDGISVTDALKAQLQIQMGCSPASIVVRSIEVADVHRNGQSMKEIICFAVSRETIMSYVELLKRCKLEPVGVHTETMAMVRAFDHLNRRDEDDDVTTLYVDMGWSGTRTAITHGRHIRFSRFIHLGGRHFDQAVATALETDLATARQHRLSFHEPYALCPGSRKNSTLPEGMAALKQAMSQPGGEQQAPATPKPATADERRIGMVPEELRFEVKSCDQGNVEGVDLSELKEMMADELAMCLRYHRVQFPSRPLDRVVFLGGESRQSWLCQHLTHQLRAPAQLGDPLARFKQDAPANTPGLNLSEPQPGWSVACGLCIAPTDL